jgi:D-glycero-alpha-D-manno-heptose-7-phosphate kinase
MLIARAPLRISFGGGGTDLEAYYAEYGGFVLSTTINKYVYGILTPNGGSSCQVISADFQAMFQDQDGDATQDELRLARAVLQEFPRLPSANLFLASEVPPGTGLGSSGTVAVNLVNILSTVCERPLGRRDAAELAYHVEVERLGAPVGKQDQYAAAFGGMNAFHFSAEGVLVEPLPIPRATIERLQRNLVLFFTGNSRRAWDILRRQRDSTRGRESVVVESLHRIKALALEMREVLVSGELEAFGHLLDASWELKKRLAPQISTGLIDSAYQAAREHGALGGKITGAGGGGFLLLYCQEEAQPGVRSALRQKGLQEMHFTFEFEGSRVLLNTGTLQGVPDLEGKVGADQRLFPQHGNRVAGHAER